jgi:hypothetical protein
MPKNFGGLEKPLKKVKRLEGVVGGGRGEGPNPSQDERFARGIKSAGESRVPVLESDGPTIEPP